MAQKILKKEKVELESNSFMTKMMANMGIKKKLKVTTVMLVLLIC